MSYNNFATILLAFFDKRQIHNKNSIVKLAMDIIKVGLYLLSFFKIPLLKYIIELLRKELSQTYEKGIFYSAVYRKVCGIFLCQFNIKQGAA